MLQAIYVLLAISSGLFAVAFTMLGSPITGAFLILTMLLAIVRANQNA